MSFEQDNQRLIAQAIKEGKREAQREVRDCLPKEQRTMKCRLPLDDRRHTFVEPSTR